MTANARRLGDDDRAREQALRALLAVRDSVCREVAATVSGAGSAATEDAVDAALEQLVAREDYLAELEFVKRGWVRYACHRLLDERRSARARTTDPVPLEEHRRALALSASTDASELSRDRASWRVREIFAVLRGDQRRWAEAWFDRFLEGGGKQPRGLAEPLGWTPSHTKEVSRAARRKMTAHIQAYASGAVCREQRAAIDAAGRQPLPAELEALLVHVVGCDECRAALHERRRGRQARGVLTWLPLGWCADAWEHLHDGARTILGAARNAAFWIAQRIGISLGDGAGATAASGGAAIGGKATAVCVGALCAAAAAGSGLVGSVPPIIPHPAQHARDRPDRPPKRTAARFKPAARPATQAATATRRLTSPLAPTRPPAPTRRHLTPEKDFTPGDLPAGGSDPVTKTASTRSATAKRSTTTPYTPGDLAPSLAATSTATSAGSGRPDRAPSSQSTPRCTPGDLGC